MAINIPIQQIKDALQEATTALIQSMGETMTVTPKDGATPQDVRAVRQKLKMEDVAGSYKEGDVRFVFDAATLNQPPKKFDVVRAANGVDYSIIDAESIDVGIDDTVLVYRPIGRG